jgi:hypothetical protein
MTAQKRAYTPHPHPTSHIDLPPELSTLLEAIARNAHEVWASQRMAAGWTYGPHRDDANKRTPALVAYEDLPDTERDYDRLMASQTLRFLLAHGYRLEPPLATGTDDRLPGSLDVLRAELASAPEPTLARVMTIWRSREAHWWPRMPALYALVAQRLLRLGEPLLAHEVLSQARSDLEPLGCWAGEHRLRHLLGLALARSGATSQAHDMAVELARDEPNDPAVLEDVLGLLGRTRKDLALQESDPGRRRTLLLEASSAYREAFVRAQGCYAAVNAASTALLGHAYDEARALAGEAQGAALAERSRARAAGQSTYWQDATLGEAALLLGEYDEARRWYGEASTAARARAAYGDLASTRRQARLIAAAVGLPSEWPDEVVRVPSVVVFAGHRIDRPMRSTPRFPAAIEPSVRAEIGRRLSEVDAGFGYSSAANGGDIIFQEEMLARGGTTHVVLPFDRTEFRAVSVTGPSEGAWEERYDAVLQHASETLEATGRRSMQSEVLLEYANALLLGMATLQARILEARLVPMVLWDGRSGARGGTGATVDVWSRTVGTPVIIDLTTLVPRVGNA